MPQNRAAQSISLASLGSSVDQAIRLAMQRHKLNVGTETLIDRWEIIGRRLDEKVNLDQAQAFAEAVSREVKVPGLKTEPVVGRLGSHIWVGFVAQSSIPKALSPSVQALPGEARGGTHQ
jgi:hypothetical protein